MKPGILSKVSVAVALLTGMVVLLGYFFGVDAAGELTTLGIIRSYVLRGGILLAATALIVGVINLASIHISKINEGTNTFYSSLLLITLGVTLVVGLYDLVRQNNGGWHDFKLLQWIFDHIQLPVETSIMAILCISLTYTAARLINKRKTVFSLIFITTLILVLLGTFSQLFTTFPILGEIKAWIIKVPAVGGARGILLGVALGSIATGIRVIMGTDRPYEN